MRAWSRVRWVVVLAAVTWLVPLHAASAYIDPGSTSVVFQAVVAAVAAVGMSLRLTWHRLRRFFRREPVPEGEHADD